MDNCAKIPCSNIQKHYFQLSICDTFGYLVYIFLLKSTTKCLYYLMRSCFAFVILWQCILAQRAKYFKQLCVHGPCRPQQLNTTSLISQSVVYKKMIIMDKCCNKTFIFDWYQQLFEQRVIKYLTIMWKIHFYIQIKYIIHYTNCYKQ